MSTIKQAKEQITVEQFAAIDIRIGKIVSATFFEEARKPAYILKIDFGPEIGVKKSSAQVTENYSCNELIGKQVAAVVNLPSRQIGPLQSEVLVLGFSDSNGGIVLFSPDTPVPLGSYLH